MNISIVIPCYNEEKILPSTVKALEKFFYKNKRFDNYELIFVDDGSTDNTLYKLMYMKATKPKNITIHSYQSNKGKGYAVRQGCLMAVYDKIAVLDADLSVKPDNLNYIYDYAVPTIDVGQRVQVIKQPFYRIFLGKGYAFLVSMIFFWYPSDTQCPYKVFHNIPSSFFKSLKVNGFSFDVEIIYKAKKQGFEMNKVLVDYHNNKETKVTIRKAFDMAVDLLKVRFTQ